MKKELRVLETESVEVREAEGKRTISGYAAVFDQVAEIFSGFYEKIARGAFSEEVGKDVRALWSHNPDLVLGRTKSGSLRLSEDSKGLRFELDLPDTTLGRDTFETIKRGDVTGVSFGFSVLKQSWEEDEEKNIRTRTLEKVKLYEISPTAFPAYEGTDVSVRSVQEILSDCPKKEVVLLTDLQKRKIDIAQKL